MRARHRLLIAHGALACVVTIGCGPRFVLHPVSGTVTLDGAPVPDVVVSFQPDSGPAAMGMTDSAGRYNLRTPGRGQGAVGGRHAVWLEPLPSDGGQPFAETAVPAARDTATVVPLRYLSPSTSGLSAVVTNDTAVIDLELFRASKGATNDQGKL